MLLTSLSSNSCIWNSWTSLRGSLSLRELMTPATSSSHWILHGLCFGFSPVSFFIVYQQRLWTNIIAGTPVINGLYLAQALVPCSSSSLWPWELNYSSAFSPKVTRIRTKVSAWLSASIPISSVRCKTTWILRFKCHVSFGEGVLAVLYYHVCLWRDLYFGIFFSDRICWIAKPFHVCCLFHNIIL